MIYTTEELTRMNKRACDLMSIMRDGVAGFEVHKDRVVITIPIEYEEFERLYCIFNPVPRSDIWKADLKTIKDRPEPDPETPMYQAEVTKENLFG